MVNTGKFASRLNKILDFYDLSAAAFADKIDVGRSSISHILSGRNKPSLDFVMKVVSSFPEVELYWLLNGKGKFPSNKKSAVETEMKEIENKQQPFPPSNEEIVNNVVEEKSNPPARKAEKQIRKIVLFYDDGSFEAFEN